MINSRRPYGSRRSWWPPSPAVTTVTVVFAGIFLLWTTGTVDFKGLFVKKPENRTAGLVAVPVSGMKVPAYAQVTRDHLWDRQAGQISVIYLRPQEVSADMMRDLGQILGRVVRREKPAGYLFTEEDFFPKGTRPGIVAGIPPGKRALRVDAERVFGLQGLQQGDRFDLVSAIPLDSGRAAVSSGGGLYAKQMEMQATLNNWNKQATVTPLVSNGLVVEPVLPRNTVVTNSSLVGGQTMGSKPVMEVIIAIDPAEVVRLTEALAINAQIHCLPRSGRPEDDPAVSVPSHAPRSPFGNRETGPGNGPMTTIETINGTNRQLIAAPEQR
jgi:Flp pilus assembly protein CpaB